MDRHQPPHPHDDLARCVEASLEHLDGTTECLDDRCRLPHAVHQWRLGCDVLDPPCPCRRALDTDSSPAADGALAAAA